jgi:mRNA interferase RelE/StbE
MLYKVIYTKSFLKEFSQLDKSVQRMIAKYIKANIDDVANPRLKGKALVGDKGEFWRYRIDDYRVIAKIFDKELVILVLKTGHRKNVYNK